MRGGISSHKEVLREIREQQVGRRKIRKNLMRIAYSYEGSVKLEDLESYTPRKVSLLVDAMNEQRRKEELSIKESKASGGGSSSVLINGCVRQI